MRTRFGFTTGLLQLVLGRVDVFVGRRGGHGGGVEEGGAERQRGKVGKGKDAMGFKPISR